MASARPTHERRETDAEINTVNQLNQDSRSQKSDFSSSGGKEKEAREDAGLPGDADSVDTEHMRSQQKGVNRIEALYRVYGKNKVAVWTLYAALAGECLDSGGLVR